MGELISLDEHRHRAHLAGAPEGARRFARTSFFFDLGAPGTYFAAERVERLFSGVRWVPVSAGAPPVAEAVDGVVAAAEARAAALGMPLVWPDPFPGDVRPAMRAAALACELGRGGAFVLAAGRLAFCGGFALADPEVLAEAAAAAGVPLDACLAAAGDPLRDVQLKEAGRRLIDYGARELPVLRVGRVLFDGEARLPEALAAVTAGAPGAARHPATA